MLGWRINLRICIYRETLSTSATSTIFYFSSIFTATFSPVRICVAAFTFPNVPLPKVLPTLTQAVPKTYVPIVFV